MLCEGTSLPWWTHDTMHMWRSENNHGHLSSLFTLRLACCCFAFFPLSMPEWLLGILAPPQEVTRITDTHAGFSYGFWGLKLRSPHLCWKWFYSLSYLPVSMALNWQIQLDVFHTKQPMVAQVDLWPSLVTYCVAPADLEVMAVLLPHPPECWNYKQDTSIFWGGGTYTWKNGQISLINNCDSPQLSFL